jgi:hypothetical protein
VLRYLFLEIFEGRDADYGLGVLAGTFTVCSGVEASGKITTTAAGTMRARKTINTATNDSF